MPPFLEDRPILSASRFGAAGDGHTDDTAALQRLIDAASEQRGIAQLEGKTYRVSNQLVLRTGVTVQGSDRHISVVKLADGWNVAEGIFVNEPGASDFGLFRCVIDGNRERRTTGWGRGVFFRNATQVRVEQVSVLNTFRENLRYDADVVDGLIDRCVLRNGDGIFLRSVTNDPSNSADQPPTCMRHRITNNYIASPKISGIICFNVKDILIQGNTIQDAAEHRGINCSPTSTDVVIANNQVYNAYSTGIHVANRCKRVHIVGNQVRGTIRDGSGIGNEGQGIKCYVGCEDITIAGNVCTQNFNDGIAVMPGARRVTIVGNRCLSNRRDGIRVHAGDGAGVLPPTDNVGITIMGNSCHGNAGSGIRLLADTDDHNNRDWIVSNNVNEANGGFGIRIDDHSVGGRIVGNLNLGNEAGSIETVGGGVEREHNWDAPSHD